MKADATNVREANYIARCNEIVCAGAVKRRRPGAFLAM